MIGLNDPYANDQDATHRSDTQSFSWLIRLTESLFSAEGWMVKRLGLEFRPEQFDMAVHTAQALAADSPLLYEAGTGVGKSLAYLLPGVMFSVATKRPFIVATHTIALQEQILEKDLEICRGLFEQIPELERFIDFKTALLVGRGNYLCGTRLAQAIETKTELFPTAQMADLERLAEWSQATETGMVQELIPGPMPEVWEWISADSHACNSRNCNPDTCFFRRALHQVRRSNLIIVNHSLLFALLGGGMHPPTHQRGILFPQDFAVLDEAHRVPGVATEHFGDRVSSFGLNRLLARLYQVPGKGRKARGLLTRIGNDRERQAVNDARNAGEEFFIRLAKQQLARRDVVRCYEEDWIDPILDGPMMALHKLLGDRINQMEDGPARDEITGMRQMVGSYASAIRNCISLSSEDHVYWLEKTGRKRDNIVLRSAPLDVADVLRERLFERKTGMVLTSATLARGSTMEGFVSLVGGESAECVQTASPFDYENQMRVYISSDAPAPTRNQSGLNVDYLADMIRFCCLRFKGGSLVLFTSYQDLSKTADLLAESFRERGRPFYQQGRDGSRQELAQRLRRDGNGILFGTESFWTGIDISGPSLSHLLITRLPFENPSHPVAEARAENCREQGGNPFVEITVPDAVIKFRQGIGRLIRRQADWGTVTILDSRILHRPYGKEFLSVMPQTQFTRFDRHCRDEVFQPLESEEED